MSFKLTLVHNDEEENTSVLTIDKSLDKRPYVAKNNFYFDGWTLTNGGTDKVSFPLTLTQDTTLYAKYLPHTGTKLRYTLSSDESYATVRRFGFVEGDVVIADTYLNVPVTEIEDKGFYWCTNMSSIKIPESITHIGDEAFGRCVSLSILKLPQNLQHIGTLAIHKCLKLKEIHIPESVQNIEKIFSEYSGVKKLIINMDQYKTSIFENNHVPYHLEEILLLPGKSTRTICIYSSDNNGFRYGANLRKITIPEGVKSIGYAFTGCSLLSEINLSEGLNSVCADGCPSLITLILPSTISHLSERSFYGSGIESITLPASLIEKMHERVFENTPKLQEFKVDPRNPAYIAIDKNLCYKKNTAYLVLYRYPIGNPQTEYTIPSCIKEIGAFAFQDADYLEKITFPEGLIKIGFEAFYEIKTLEEITFPKSLEVLDSGAFEYAKSIKRITFLRPASMGITTIGYNALEYIFADEVIVPDEESAKAYRDAQYMPKRLKDQIIVRRI